MSVLMILGGSNCQKNALRAAKRLGHRTVLVDYYENPPAKELADIHVRASTFDVPACIAAAKAHHVDGVFTIGTDQPVLTAARVAKACGLPSPISVETARAVTNKRVMKRLLTAHGIPTVAWKLVEKGAGVAVLAGMCPPFVIKPLDSQGQRGIFKVHSEAELLERLPQTLAFSREDEALAEEFYPSGEITVSAWVHAGTAHLLTVTDRQLYDDPSHIGVCVGHRFPSVHMGEYEVFARLTQRIAEVFEIAEGPLYIQYLNGAQGIVVNELACRIGGAFEDVFIPWLTGFDILGAVIAGALGKDTVCTIPFERTPAENTGQVSVQLMFCHSGRIASVTPLETMRGLPGVLDAGYNFAAGDTIPAMENATARFGHCVLTATDGGIEERLANFYKTFRVWDDNRENLVIPRDFAGGIAPHSGKGECV